MIIKNNILIKTIMLFFVFLLWVLPYSTFADTNIWENINYNKNIELWSSFNIDLTDIKQNLEKQFWTKIIIEWNLKWENTQIWDIFTKQFDKIWQKEINLNIYKLDGWEKNLLLNKYIDLFVYKQSQFILFDNSIENEEIDNFVESAKESWINIILNHISKEKLNEIDILEQIKRYNNITTNSSDYISIWWEKNFILSLLSKLNREIEISKYNEQLNFTIISWFNADVLKNYLKNFLSNKSWINEIIMINEVSKSQIIKEPWKIEKLKTELINNQYYFLEIDTNNKINDFLFISKFINNLSSKWFNTDNIYLLIIIPFLLTWISIFKHLIGLSPVWITIPIFITILFFKIWILVSLILLFILFITNLIVSTFINKYTLLYTPKISFVSIINIVTTIIAINVLYQYNLLNINITDSIFIILLIVISERLITIILSKEFGEYKSHLINTIIFCVVSFIILDINLIKTFFLAYPEIILFLIPLNFTIWRFTWLRITEYFRFKKNSCIIIKNDVKLIHNNNLIKINRFLLWCKLNLN